MKSISIIGLGLIGGSLAKACKQYNSDIFISAFDKDEVLQIAFQEKIIDEKLSDYKDSLKNNLIIISLPTGLSVEIFSELIPLLKPEQLITDVCGVKSVFEEIWNKNKQEGNYLGGHPMTGKEKGGYKNSDSLLFENSIYILTKKIENSESFDHFVNIIQNIGSRIKYVDAFTHDKIVSKVSHLPQLLSVALVNSAAGEKGINPLDFAAGGFRDMTRIASSGFLVWESILRFNKKEIIEALNNFNSVTDNIKLLLEKDNYNSISEMFNNAISHRDEIPKNIKGFIHPLVDIFVFVKDEPGVLSKMTAHLYNNGINIKDIELLKIREGTGGTFRISFTTKEEAENSKLLLEEIGFKVNKE